MTTLLTPVTQAEVDELREVIAEVERLNARGPMVPRLLHTIEDLWASSRSCTEAYDDLRAQLQAVTAERDRAVEAERETCIGELNHLCYVADKGGNRRMADMIGEAIGRIRARGTK